MEQLRAGPYTLRPRHSLSKYYPCRERSPSRSSLELFKVPGFAALCTKQSVFNTRCVLRVHYLYLTKCSKTVSKFDIRIQISEVFLYSVVVCTEESNPKCQCSQSSLAAHQEPLFTSLNLIILETASAFVRPGWAERRGAAPVGSGGPRREEPASSCSVATAVLLPTSLSWAVL